MGAPKGNTFFRLVKSPGRPKKYTPRGLWAKGLKYFEWVVKNPLYEQKAFATGPNKTLPKMRAMTELAFCLFAGIDKTTFNDYKSNKEEYKDYSHIANKISDIIYTQKFEGASADLLNSAIISRELGMIEKHDVTTKGKALAQLPPVVIQPIEHTDSPILESEPDE